jgi:hypothetical protein
MPKVLLQYPPAMTRADADMAYNRGRTRFWVAQPNKSGDGYKRFIPIGNHSAVYPLNALIKMPLGVYILGAGFGRNRLRRKFIVDLAGIKFLEHLGRV